MAIVRYVGNTITCLSSDTKPINIPDGARCYVTDLTPAKMYIKKSGSWEEIITNSIPMVTPGTTGNVLTSNGTIWTSIVPAIPSIITVENEITDTTCYPLFGTALTGNITPKTNANLTYDALNNIISLQSSTASIIGSELITNTADRTMSGANNWSGTNWTVGSNVYTHTAGENLATLSGYAAIADAVYQIVMTVVTTTAGTLTIVYGGQSAALPIGQVVKTLTAYTVYITASNTNGLVLIPNATWAGTIDNVSIKLVTPNTSSFYLKDVLGNICAEGMAIDSTSFGIGKSSLKYSNSGGSDIGIGAGTLMYNIGSGNTACGAYSLYRNTIGSGNVAVGSSALEGNTIGFGNIAIGQWAFINNNTGHYNIGIGYSSGEKITNDSNNTSSLYSIFIGDNTKAKADGETNQIVIGSGTIGNGSNTVTIGNTSITGTYLGGKVGIGNSSVSELLTLGTAGTTAGTLSLAGATSGKAIIAVSDIAGAPTLTLPTTTGTIALTTDSIPMVTPGTTGNVLTSNGSIWQSTASAAGSSRWTETTGFTATPTSTSSLTFAGVDKTATLKVGIPVRYTISSVIYYGIITACTFSTNTVMTIAGAPMGGDVTKLEYGNPEMVVPVSLPITGTYGDATDTDLLYNDMGVKMLWRLGTAYCVKFSATEKTVDTGAEPKVNILVNTQRVSTNDSNLGIQLTTAGAWVDNSAVAINTTYYDINNGEALTLECTANGGTGDAAHLTMEAVFVLA